MKKPKIEFIEWHAPWMLGWNWIIAYHPAPEKSHATFIFLGFQWLVTY